MIAVFGLVAAAVIKVATIEAFTSGALLGSTFYVASRSNKVVRQRVKGR